MECKVASCCTVAKAHLSDSRAGTENDGHFRIDARTGDCLIVMSVDRVEHRYESS